VADLRIEYLDFTPGRLGRWTMENDVWTVAAASIHAETGPASWILIAALGYEVVGANHAARLSRHVDVITRAERVLATVVPAWRERLAARDVETVLAFDLTGQLVQPPRGDWGQALGVPR
jgi:hypothetical protein